MSEVTTPFEVLIIGAGPAGLTAALYLARYRRSVHVLHDGRSRALRIPRTYNAPGFPDGVVGADLIGRMTEHALTFGATVEQTEIRNAERTDGFFRLTGADGRTWKSRALILATGIRLNQVDLPHDLHEAAIRADVLRYCPVCDGYEHTDRRIGVVGCDANGAAEALFLRQYSEDITLMPLDHSELSPAQVAELDEAGIVVAQGALSTLTPSLDRIEVRLEGRSTPLSFDVLYPALGSTPRSRLAVDLGVSIHENGCLASDAPKRTNVPGLFAAGDVVDGLDQLSVAIGHGALAATNAHNWLRDQDRHSLQARD